MSERPFQTLFEDLPSVLPLFPLPGVLLLPGGKLPLNVFERRYLAMVEDALGQPGRLVGMIQPSGPAPSRENESGKNESGENEPPLYETGCAGRISAFAETEDGRIAMTLTGVCRFRLVEETAPVRGYRRALPDWTPFRADLAPAAAEAATLERERLLAVLKAYVRLHNMDVNWKAVEAASDQALLTSLPMVCPFEPSEKQALLECLDISRRAQILISLLEMAVAGKQRGQALVRQ